MENLLRAGAVALGLVFCASAHAQSVGSSAQCEGKDASGNCLPGNAPLAAVSTAVPLSMTITSAGGAISGSVGSCSGTGTATCGPFTPQLGLPIRLVIKGGATHSTYVGTTVNGCASVNQLTALGSPVSFTGNVDEYVDVPPTSGNIQYCVVSSVGSGTATVTVRQ